MLVGGGGADLGTKASLVEGGGVDLGATTQHVVGDRASQLHKVGSDEQRGDAWSCDRASRCVRPAAQ
jgi:hypothetical protein